MPISDAVSVAFAAGSLPFPARLAWFRTFLAWQRRALRERVPSDGPVDVTAIVLSYRRPQNIRPIVRALLRHPRIRRVLVSNNNCRTELSAGLGLKDDRVHVVQQSIDRPTHLRYQLALLDDADSFLFVDDDVFFTPLQIDRVIRGLDADPAVPHGVVGQIYDPWMDRMHHDVRDHEGPLDILNCVYACTRRHIVEFFRIVDQLGFGPTSPYRTSSFWDDMVLSHAGSAKPKTHRVGSFPVCPTTALRGTAECAADGFFRWRIKIFKRLRTLRPL